MGETADRIEEEDARLLAEVPDTLCVGTMMKASPHEEGGARYLYIQASDESVDAQGERVLCKALQESATAFTKFGVVDIDHVTMLRERSGIPNYQEYEIGRPVEVRFDQNRTFVKAQLYTGDTVLATRANMVWDSLTRLSPPARWYASVGGTARAKAIEIDPVTKARVPVIKAVNWFNLAISKTPVNQSVPVASTMPFGVFAKSLNGFVVKGLEAGYGTDLNTLEGSGALRTQSLDEAVQSYWSFSEAIARDLRKGACGSSEAAIADHAQRAYGIRRDKATAWTTRFLADLHEAIEQGKS